MMSLLEKRDPSCKIKLKPQHTFLRTAFLGHALHVHPIYPAQSEVNVKYSVLQEQEGTGWWDDREAETSMLMSGCVFLDQSSLLPLRCAKSVDNKQSVWSGITWLRGGLAVEHTMLRCLSETMHTDLSAQHCFQKLNSFTIQPWGHNQS